MKPIIRSSTGALLTVLIAAGCSTAPRESEVAAANTALGNAGQVVDRAVADPNVAKYASTELDRAQESLHQANEAWNKKHDLQTTTHLAYMAQQRAATAQEMANTRVAEEAVRVAANERNQAVTRVVAERQTITAEQVVQDLPGFATGKAKLPRGTKERIDELAANMKSNPNSVIVVEGYTDNVGSPQYNQGLAMRRAEAVRKELIRQGVDSNRIQVRAHGEENPIASNDTMAGRSENRRAQVILADQESRMVGSSGSSGTTSSGSGEQPAQGQQSQQQQSEQSQQPPQSEQPPQNEQPEQRE